MYYVPYFKSKKHIIFFVSFLVSSILCWVLFAAGVIATILSKEPEIENDPAVTGLVLALVIAILVNILFTVLFIIDLVSYFVTKRKAKTMKSNNVEVVIK